MEWIAADSDEQLELIHDTNSLSDRLRQLKEYTTHSIYTSDAPQQLMEGIQRYAGADTLVPEPQWIGQKQVSLEVYQQQRATQAMHCMAAGGFVLRIFNRT